MAAVLSSFSCFLTTMNRDLVHGPGCMSHFRNKLHLNAKLGVMVNLRGIGVALNASLVYSFDIEGTVHVNIR
jgi:hypothetical protein